MAESPPVGVEVLDDPLPVGETPEAGAAPLAPLPSALLLPEDPPPHAASNAQRRPAAKRLVDVE
ncbi:hypothetical protein [Noviherbaspirillum aridicola]|uniref:hypothetical protein n=1 Tax=Noviherbaspirillum aridicola TaxID=2849687 RepID=UPI001C7FC9FC|nr:hypothetical protein [Noviherbaspirillum aridicola]